MKFINSKNYFVATLLAATLMANSIGMSANAETMNKCDSSANLVIVSASDDGTHDGHGPSNTIDGNTNSESRWSSKGMGKAITWDLGQTSTVRDIQVMWHNGGSRNAYFDIDISSNNNDWTRVLYSGVSSGSNSGFETHDITDSSARYVRLVGSGNSTGNDWNSIVETRIRGCGNVAPPNPDPDPDPDPNPGPIDIDMSLFDREGRDPRDGNTMKFDALRERVVTPNGNGWRHELKIKKSKRVAMTDVYEDFQANIKVNLSKGSKTIVAQHHASGKGTIVKLYISDTSESGFMDSVAKNGVFDVYVRMAKQNGSGEVKRALGTMRTGQSFNFRVINDYGYVTVNAFGRSFSLNVRDSSKSYFKFGNYLQAQDPVTLKKVKDSKKWAKFYRDTGITKSLVTMSNIRYVRNLR